MEDLAQLISSPRLDAFFYSRDATEVARDLLGKIMIHRINPTTIYAARILETEAYLQHGDEASHSRRGKTQRNQSMFGEPGTCYVYLIYGLHYCLNVSTGPKDQGDAVLFRWGIPLWKSDLPQNILQKILKGPGKFARGMGFTRNDDGLSFCEHKFWIADDGFRMDYDKIFSSPRIGITKATDLHYRYFVKSPPELMPRR